MVVYAYLGRQLGPQQTEWFGGAEQRVWVVHFAPLGIMTNDLLPSHLAFGCERFGFREPLQEFRRESRNLAAHIVAAIASEL